MLRPHVITDLLMSHETEGLSVDMYGQEPADGYMVGGEVPSLILKADEMYPFKATDAYIEQHYALLATGDYYAGIWRDNETGLTYIDISRNVADLYTALAIADARGELAVWDVENGREIRTELAENYAA